LKDPKQAIYWRILLSAAAASCIANISWFMQPQIVDSVINGFKASESAAGFVVTGELTAMALTSFVIARLARGLSYLTLCLGGLVLAVAGALATLAVRDYGTLIVIRGITGIGEGAFLMVSTAAVAHLPNPDRAYGQINIVNIVLGASMSLGLPFLLTRFGSDTLPFRLLAALMAVLVVLTLAMPRAERYSPPLESSGHSASGRVIAIAVGVFLVVVASAACWSFFVVFGLRTGLSAAQVDTAIGYSVLAGLPGGVLATFVGARFGRSTPMALAMLITVGAIFVLTYSTDPMAFRVATCINIAGIYFLYPYFFGCAAAEDASGRAAAIAGGAFLLTGAVGPYLGGLLLEYLGARSIAWFMLIGNAIAAVLFTWLERSHQHAPLAARASV
jgi:predicted MFS family arabinose efflux permease